VDPNPQPRMRLKPFSDIVRSPKNCIGFSRTTFTSK
jgi:hypothetical protein